MAASIIIEGGFFLEASDELLDTIVVGHDKKSYIRTADGLWKEYQDRPVPVKAVNKTDKAPALKQQKKKRKSRPPTAYNVFLKRVLSELSVSHSDMDCKDRMLFAAAKWRNRLIS